LARFFIKIKTGRAVPVLLTWFFLFTVVVGGFGVPVQPCSAGEMLTAAEMAAKAVEFINGKYQEGETIDGYTAYILKLAGADLAGEKWTRGPERVADDQTLKRKVEKLSELLGNESSLITYLTTTQNSDGSFGPYANENGTKAPLQALAAVKDDTAVGATVYAAVKYFKDGYQNGSMSYEVDGWDFDYRCVEALAAAGEELGDWIYEGVSLKDAVISSAEATAADPTVPDAVYLAKELTVLRAVYPGSADIANLADAIIAKQATTVGGQVYFGGSVYDDVMVLTALGKAGKLDGVQAGALDYLNDFKCKHTDSRGNPAGAAWGGWDPEEPDLTAQVLTALSYFDGATEVDAAIQDGLAYLADIQDPDTAAVTAQWDSTFATAETLLALQALGKTYDESPWVKASKTKTIAQCLLACSKWEDGADRADRLAGLLAGRQKTDDGPDKGSFENSVYSDMWAYLALGEAGKIGLINTTAAREYLLSKQGVDGSWGEEFDGIYYPDFLSTTQAIRAFTYLPDADGDVEIQEAINKGLAYLKGLQQDDGGVYDAWDDPAVDNAELIVTLDRLGVDPAGADWKNSAGLTPVDYLLNGTMNDDGSFGSAKNVFGAAETLSACLLVGGSGSPPGGSNGNGSSSSPSKPDYYSVNIAVAGMNGVLLYGPGKVTVREDGAWGGTVMGALDATGLSYTESGGLVSSIAGQANSGMNGWMYKVNGTVPMAAAGDKTVREGDRVIWWYSEDMSSSGPEWDSLVKEKPVTTAPSNGETPKTAVLPPDLQLSQEAGEALDEVALLLGLKEDTGELALLGETVKTVVVVDDRLPDWAASAVLKAELAANVVDVVREVEAAEGAVLADELGEVALAVPAGALNRDVTITIKEASLSLSSNPGTAAHDAVPRIPVNHRQVSPVYNFGPDGTTFTVPAHLTLRFALPPLVHPENLVLARHDVESGQWMALPAVVDLSKGLISARVSHFSDFAVLARQDKKTFADVTAGAFGWAQEAVELLAGAGVLAGVDGKCYAPGRAVTRGELAKILAEALNIPAAESGPAFKDLKEEQWHAGYVAAVAENGLVKGYQDGTFGPDRAVTREELVVILARVLELEVPSGTEMPFRDAGKISAWAQANVAAAAATGLVAGYPDGAFKPREKVTRAECAVMVCRALAGL
jgi:hypothetical protein